MSTECDATNAKGDYKIAVSKTESNADKIRVTGKSATSNVVIVPQTIYTTNKNDVIAGACTANGLTTTLIDTSLASQATLIGRTVYFETGANAGSQSQVQTDPLGTPRTLTLSPAFGNITTSGDTYQIY